MIRNMQEKDIDNVLNLGQDFHKESPIFNKYKYNNNKFKSFIKHIIQDDSSIGVVAYRDDELIGMILGNVEEHFFSDVKTLDEYVIYVKKKYRGGKTVFKMIKEWSDWGSKMGAKDIWAWNTSGINSNKFFKHIGFKEVGTVLRRQ